MLATITTIGQAVFTGFAVAVTVGFLFPTLAPDLCVGIGLAVAAHGVPSAPAGNSDPPGRTHRSQRGRS